MISCREARRTMVDALRPDADEATRLQLELHLDGCPACQKERERWALVGALRDYAPAPLGAAADRRIVGKLVASRTATEPAPRAPRRWAWVAVPAVAAAALIVTSIWSRSTHREPAEGARLEAQREGRFTFAGALVRYLPGTALEFHPGRRTLGLSKGEVDVDVTPGGKGRFRVITPRFIVEVLGTRFVVTPDGVRTLRGLVRVLDRKEQEMSVLHAGQSWSMPAAPIIAARRPASAPAPVQAPPPAPTVAPAPAVARATTGPAGMRPSAASLIARAKQALADGDTGAARSWVNQALRADPVVRDLAAAHLLLADARLVEKRPDEAISAYREVARRHGRTPEGETALFALGQLLVERGRPAEAAAAFHDYLARYPMGRFLREVRERIEQVQPSH